MTTYGIPEHIRSDNGTEFIAQKIQAWLRENQIKTLYIDSDGPLAKRLYREHPQSFSRRMP